MSAPDPQLEALVSAVNATRAASDAAVANLLTYLGRTAFVVDREAPTRVAEPERRVDLVGMEWIEIGAAASRFGISKDSIWRWCDRDPNFGWKRGGRWLVSVTKMRARLNIR